MKKIKILISGINGYLSRNLANELVRNEQFEIYGFGRNTHKHKKLKEEISIVHLNELESFVKMNEIDIIIHAATNYGRSNCSVESILETNLMLAIRLYSIARASKVRSFINIDTILPRDYSEYALSKKQFVEWAEKLHLSNKYFLEEESQKEFQFINVKFEHFYGPGAPSHNFISWVTEQIKENVQQIKLTDCTQKREFLYINDAVSALITVIQNLEELSSFESITIGTGNPIVLRDLLFMARDIFGSTSTFNFGAIPLPLNQKDLGFYDHSRIRELGWQANESLESGLLKIKNQINE